MQHQLLDPETLENWRQILTPAGIAWSGRARYAAAMFFRQRGEMGEEVLEIYRICSRIDGEDALDALRAYRMGEDWIGRAEAMRALLAEGASSDPDASR